MPVAREDMVKGYEFAKDQYVMFTPEELKAMEEAGTHMAEITEFVPLEAVDPVYFDKAYYLAPDKGGAKPYALLASALRESKRCALGRWAARGKQYIVMIRPVEDGLVMQQLLYAGEVRAMKDLEIPEDRSQARRVEARAAADRAAGVRHVRSVRSTPTKCARASRRRCRRRSRARRSRWPRRPKAAARRSSTSWRRCARASRRRRRARAQGRRAAPAAARKPPKRAQQARGRRAGGAQAREESVADAAGERRRVQPYGVRDVEKLLRLPRSTIRALIAAGFVSPARGPRGAWLFSFQDLIVLRTAQALAAANVPQRRITRSVRELRRHLPDSMPLSGLSASAPWATASSCAKAAAAGRRSPANTCSSSRAIPPTAR